MSPHRLETSNREINSVWEETNCCRIWKRHGSWKNNMPEISDRPATPPLRRNRGIPGLVCVRGRKTDWGWDKEPKVERDKGWEQQGVQSAVLFFLGGPVWAFHKQQLRVLVLPEWATERQIKASSRINAAVFPLWYLDLGVPLNLISSSFYYCCCIHSLTRRLGVQNSRYEMFACKSVAALAAKRSNTV